MDFWRRARGRPKTILGEGQSRKSETKLDGRAGKYKRLHKTESVGQTAWKLYAPTSAMRLDDDDDDDDGDDDWYYDNQSMLFIFIRHHGH